MDLSSDEKVASTQPNLPGRPDDVIITCEEWNRRARSAGDKIFVRNLTLNTRVALDAWGREKPQPVLISVVISLSRSFQSAAEKDELNQSTVHYGTLSKAIVARVREKGPESLGIDAFAHLIMEAAYEQISSPRLVQMMEVEHFLPKASLLGAGVGFRYCRETLPLDAKVGYVTKVLFIKDLRIPTIVGLNNHERKLKQLVVVNIWIDPLRLIRQKGLGYHNVLQQTVIEVSICHEKLIVRVWLTPKIQMEAVEGSSFLTLESLATKLASILVERWVPAWSPGSDVRIRVEKPSAITDAEAPGVEILRSSRASVSHAVDG